jgi:hypothetical protein
MAIKTFPSGTMRTVFSIPGPGSIREGSIRGDPF